jgi:P-type conjugative transfer ATPase TrbB
MLRTALGPAITGWLEDPAIVEVMLNPDGRLWIDRLAGGLADTGERLSAADGERIVRLVAHHVGAEVHPASPRVSAELPGTGERFEGLIPPVVAAPAFAIRKPAVAIFTLRDYASTGIMTGAEILRHAVMQRRNILVAGGTSTGKTTLVNALLAEVANTADRVVLIEDTRELQCKAPNLVALRTKDGVASLSDLVRSSLRLRPDRIPIGEVRGSEALDLLKAWGTGHPGGIGPRHCPLAHHPGNNLAFHRCSARWHSRVRGWLEHAMGATASTDPAIDRGPGFQDHRGDHHHRDRPDARIRRYRRRIPAPHPDRVRPLDRIRGVLVLPLLLLIRRRSADLMAEILTHEPIAGFEAPVHRALTEPILLAGAPRAVAILNGTLSAAIGLGLRLWIAGLVLWAFGHMAAVWAAKRDPLFVEVVRRHVRYPAHLGS